MIRFALCLGLAFLMNSGFSPRSIAQENASPPPVRDAYYYIVECRINGAITLKCGQGATPNDAIADAHNCCANAMGTVVQGYFTDAMDPTCPPPPLPCRTTACWEVYISVCCCDGTQFVVKGRGDNYCQAKANGQRLACKIAAYYQGARCCRVSCVNRPPCCQPCCQPRWRR